MDGAFYRVVRFGLIGHIRQYNRQLTKRNNLSFTHITHETPTCCGLP